MADANSISTSGGVWKLGRWEPVTTENCASSFDDYIHVWNSPDRPVKLSAAVALAKLFSFNYMISLSWTINLSFWHASLQIYTETLLWPCIEKHVSTCRKLSSSSRVALHADVRIGASPWNRWLYAIHLLILPTAQEQSNNRSALIGIPLELRSGSSIFAAARSITIYTHSITLAQRRSTWRNTSIRITCLFISSASWVGCGLWYNILPVFYISWIFLSSAPLIDWDF